MSGTPRTVANPWTEQELVKARELLEEGYGWNEIEARMDSVRYALRATYKLWAAGKRGTVMEGRREQRRAIEAMIYQGRTIEEISAAIEIPYKTAYHRIINLGFTARDLREIRIELGLEERRPGRAPRPVRTATPRRIAAVGAHDLSRQRRAAEFEAHIAALRAPHVPSMPAGARIAIEQVARRTGVSALDILGQYLGREHVAARHQAILAVWELYANRGSCWLAQIFRMDHSGIIRILKKNEVYGEREEPESEYKTFNYMRAA